MKSIDEVRHLISENRLESVFEELLLRYENNQKKRDSVYSIKAQHNTLKHENIRGVITYKNKSLGQNLIVDKLLNLISLEDTPIEPVYKRYNLKRILFISTFIFILFFGWSIMDEPKLLESKIDTNKMTILIEHESLFFTDVWFYLSNSDLFFWMKKRYVKIDNEKPQLIIQSKYHLPFFREENQNSLTIKIFRGRDEKEILENKSFSLKN